jgi:hypothetical protein
VTGTAQAGGASTITLAAGASATDDAYLGMIIDITSGTGSGQQAMIVGYNGTTKVATVISNTATGVWAVNPGGTSVYAIRANVQYRPISTAIPTLTFYGYDLQSIAGNVILQKILGAVGSWRVSLAPRGVPRLSMNFGGALQAPTDVSAPSAATFQATRGVPWMGAHVALGGARVGVNELSFDLRAPFSSIPDQTQTYGVSQSLHAAGRRNTGRIVPPKRLIATHDPFTLWRNGTAQSIATWWGPAAGQRVALLWPRAVYTAVDSVDVGGLDYQGLSFSSASENAGVIVTFW